MLLTSFNSSNGFSVGQLYPIDIADSNGNIIANNITVSAKANLGPISNLVVTGGSAGQAIITDGTGNLSFTSISSSGLSNGSSNIQILNNSNISFSSAGNANIMIVTGTGVNVVGTLNATGNANVGNLETAGAVTASTLTSNVATGTAPVTVSSTTLVANLNADLLDGYDTATANTANTVAVRDANGSISANFFIGNGQSLTTITGANVSGFVPNANVANTAFIAANVSGVGNIYIESVYSGNNGQILQELLNSNSAASAQTSLNVDTFQIGVELDTPQPSVWNFNPGGSITFNYANGPSIPLGIQYSEATANILAVPNTSYLVDTSVSSITITLPATPVFGMQVGIIDGTGQADLNEITVVGNGSNIQGINSSMTVNTSRAAFTLVYYNAAQGWILTNV
jgi:hypothetical protein